MKLKQKHLEVLKGKVTSFKEQLYIKSVTLAAKELKLCIKALLYMENLLSRKGRRKTLRQIILGFVS